MVVGIVSQALFDVVPRETQPGRISDNILVYKAKGQVKQMSNEIYLLILM
jgi:hypothetical protein